MIQALFGRLGLTITLVINMKALLILLFTSFAFAQSLPTGAVQAAPERYADVPENHWAYDAVTRLTTLGVFTGYPNGMFLGEQTASRYELAVVAARLLAVTSTSLILQDPELKAELTQAVSDLKNLQQLDDRLERLELGLENSASLVYAQSLEARIIALEAQLNAAYEQQLFSAAPDTSVAQSAAQTVTALPELNSDTTTTSADSSNSASTTHAQGSAVTLNEPLVKLPFTLGEANSERYWFGISTGYPLGATLHFGIHDVFSSADLRLSSSLGLGGAVDLGLSSILELPVTIAELPTTVYSGLGSTLTVESPTSSLNAQAFLGIEYRLGGTQPGGIYMEFGPVLEIIPEIDSSFVWKLGFNYHF